MSVECPAERTRKVWPELELGLELGLELALELELVLELVLGLELGLELVLELEVEMLEPLACLIPQEECAEKGLSPVLNPNPVS